MSTIVVISGDAMIAGSSLTRFASIGSMHAIAFDIMTVAIIARLTVSASLYASTLGSLLYVIISRMALTTERAD